MAETAVAPSPPKQKRDRSPSFPFIPLKTAIERLEAFEKHFGRHPTPANRAGAAWVMKDQSSQADQTLAALRSFGLVIYDGMGPKRTVSISEDGRRYIRAQQEEIKDAVRKQAALRPKIIRKFWALWGEDRPVDAVALDALILENGFSDKGARDFLKVYDDTVAYAKLSMADKVTADEDAGDDELEGENGGNRENKVKPPLNPPLPTNKVKVMEGERIAFTEELEAGNYLKLIASGDLNDFLLEALEDFVKRQRKRLEMAVRSTSYMGGSFVPVSGVYNVTHHGHNGPTQITAKKGDMFPLCGDCISDEMEVLYTLAQQTS